ncbi:MAG TPA: diaminopimelate decarboxylase [Terriglobales bacterium]|nr:diaminopimelate decarboxylase [Terriglobales bacterium]
MSRSRPPGRPPGFSYRPGGRGSWLLHCEQVPVARLAERFDTPLYVYSASAMRQRMDAFERAFARVPHTICFSIKANSNLGILRLLAKMGCGFDVVSGGELDRVLRVDRRAVKRVVFSGVGKTKAEMRAALRAGILLFNVESESELGALAECAAQLKLTAPVALRVNPDVPAETHPYISTGLEKHKFGVPMGEARRLYRLAAETRYLRVAGVSVHIGSQITDVKPFAAAMERVRELVDQLRAEGHSIAYLDAGGGLGINYQASQGPANSSDFTAAVSDYAAALLGPLRGLKLHLLLEPGRSIVAAAGALLTRVIYRKANGVKKFLVVDAAMNDLIRPSLYQAYHEIVPSHLQPEAAKETIDVVGPVCETGDFFARDRQLPVASEGDLLAILDAGAYGMSLASNYNTRGRPAEILVVGKSIKRIRRRETTSDLMRSEI